MARGRRGRGRRAGARARGGIQTGRGTPREVRRRWDIPGGATRDSRPRAFRILRARQGGTTGDRGGGTRRRLRQRRRLVLERRRRASRRNSPVTKSFVRAQTGGSRTTISHSIVSHNTVGSRSTSHSIISGASSYIQSEPGYAFWFSLAVSSSSPHSSTRSPPSASAFFFFFDLVLLSVTRPWLIARRTSAHVCL